MLSSKALSPDSNFDIWLLNFPEHEHNFYKFMKFLMQFYQLQLKFFFSNEIFSKLANSFFNWVQLRAIPLINKWPSSAKRRSCYKNFLVCETKFYETRRKSNDANFSHLVTVILIMIGESFLVRILMIFCQNLANPCNIDFLQQIVCKYQIWKHCEELLCFWSA